MIHNWEVLWKEEDKNYSVEDGRNVIINMIFSSRFYLTFLETLSRPHKHARFDIFISFRRRRKRWSLKKEEKSWLIFQLEGPRKIMCNYRSRRQRRDWVNWASNRVEQQWMRAHENGRSGNQIDKRNDFVFFRRSWMKMAKAPQRSFFPRYEIININAIKREGGEGRKVSTHFHLDVEWKQQKSGGCEDENM